MNFTNINISHLFKGRFTLDDSYIVSPFKSTFRYIAGIPYSVVSTILPKLNKVGNNKKRAFPIDGVTFSVSSAERFRDYAYHNQTVSIVPGYTTTDDYGTDGDDTVHSRIDDITESLVDYIGTPFPANPKPNDLYDLVYLDFFEQTVVRFVKELKSSTPPTGVYRNDGVDINKMYPEFVKKAWSKTC